MNAKNDRFKAVKIIESRKLRWVIYIFCETLQILVAQIQKDIDTIHHTLKTRDGF